MGTEKSNDWKPWQIATVVTSLVIGLLAYYGTESRVENGAILNTGASESTNAQNDADELFKKLQNGVWTWVSQNLHDADSYEAVNWGQIIKYDDNLASGKAYRMVHDYRAKNALGAIVNNTTVFIFDKNGNVLSTE